MSGRSKRVLVTGAGGFIGSAALALLARQGYAAVGIGRHAPLSIPHDAEWVTLNLASLEARNALDSLPTFDTVVHCAAAIPKSFTDDSSREAGDINAAIDQTVIDYCIRQNARLIYCSGTSVYGLVSNGLIGEEHFLNGAFSPYIQSKILSESRIRERLLSYAILRICAPYGTLQSAKTVLKIFIETAIAGGVLYYYGSGSREQDFVHVRDVAEAMRSAVARTHVTNTFNIAGGSPISMKDLALTVVAIIGNPSASVRRSGSDDVQEDYRARFDISRAKQQLDWSPKITLQEGIREWATSMGARGA